MVLVSPGGTVRFGKSIEVFALFSVVRRLIAIARVKGVAPMFVSWIFCVIGKDFTTPSEIVAGERIRLLLIAAAALSLPAPTDSTLAGLPFSVTSCVAVLITDERIDTADIAG